MIRNRIINYLLGILIAACLLAGCSPEVTSEKSPTAITTSTLRSEPQPSPTVLEPTYTSNPPTNTPSPPTTPVSAFPICDQPTDGEVLGGTSSQQEGLSRDVDSSIPPAPPANVSFTLSEERVVVTWQGTGTDVDQSYNVYQLGTEERCWVLIGTKPVEGENQGVYTFDTVTSGQPDANFYAVTTIDIYDNESDLSIAGGPEPTS